MELSLYLAAKDRAKRALQLMQVPPRAGAAHARIVGIIGPNHSGTTLLGCILGSTRSFEDVFHAGEYHTFFEPRQRVFHCNKHARAERCPVWADMPVKRGGYHHIVERTGARVIVDSSKLVEWFERQHRYCRFNGWDMRMIVCWRDILSLGYSKWKRGKDLGAALAQVEDNLERTARGLELASRIDPAVVVVNADDLVREPRAITRQVCAITGIPYFEGKERYWEFEHHHLWGNGRQSKHIKGIEAGGYQLSEARDPAFSGAPYAPLLEKYAALLERLNALSVRPDELVSAG